MPLRITGFKTDLNISGSMIMRFFFTIRPLSESFDL